MSPNKSEALNALAHIRKRLDDPAPLEGLARSQVKAAAEYAVEQVELIQEVKRQRKTHEKLPARAMTEELATTSIPAADSPNG